MSPDATGTAVVQLFCFGKFSWSPIRMHTPGRVCVAKLRVERAHTLVRTLCAKAS